MKLETGQPLTVLDQCIGEASIPKAAHQLVEFDSVLAVAKEKIQLAKAKVKPFTPSEAAQADSAQKLIDEFQLKCQTTNLFDFKLHYQSLTQFVEEFQGKLDQSLEIYQ